MIKTFVKGRVYVFIDAANILYSQQTLGWRVDYKKLKEYFEQECDLRAIHFYTGRIGEDGKQTSKGHISKELLDRAKYINLSKLKEIISFRP